MNSSCQDLPKLTSISNQIYLQFSCFIQCYLTFAWPFLFLPAAVCCKIVKANVSIFNFLWSKGHFLTFEGLTDICVLFPCFRQNCFLTLTEVNSKGMTFGFHQSRWLLRLLRCRLRSPTFVCIRRNFNKKQKSCLNMPFKACPLNNERSTLGEKKDFQFFSYSKIEIRRKMTFQINWHVRQLTCLCLGS